MRVVTDRHTDRQAHDVTDRQAHNVKTITPETSQTWGVNIVHAHVIHDALVHIEGAGYCYCYSVWLRRGISAIIPPQISWAPAAGVVPGGSALRCLITDPPGTIPAAGARGAPADLGWGNAPPQPQ